MKAFAVIAPQRTCGVGAQSRTVKTIPKPSGEAGDAEIEVVLPHGSELSDLLHWALPDQRLVICGNLRARIHEELSAVFAMLQESAG
jgi:hypothetical protein